MKRTLGKYLQCNLFPTPSESLPLVKPSCVISRTCLENRKHEKSN